MRRRPRWLKPAEVADYWRLNVETVYRRIRSGDLPAVRVGGQYRIAEKDALTAGRRIAVGAHGRQQSTISTVVDNCR